MVNTLSSAFLFYSYRKNSLFTEQNSQRTSGGKEVFQKKPLGRRRHLMSEPTGSANLVPLRLERSESAASPKYFLAGAPLK